MCQLNYPTLTVAIAPFAPAAGNLPPTGPGTPTTRAGSFLKSKILPTNLPFPVLTNRARQAQRSWLTDIKVRGVALH